MTVDDLRPHLQLLTQRGLVSMAESTFGVIGGTAYFDTRKDQLITSVSEFQPAVEALARTADLQTRFGAEQAPRIAIQFVFNVSRRVAAGVPNEAAFEEVWQAFSREINTPTWTFTAVANVQNVDCSENNIQLGDGVSVRGRSFEELASLLNWGSAQLDYLARDWSEGAMSSFVMIVEKTVVKSPDTFLLQDDGTAYTRAARTLLAMRLLAPGDVRIGRLFLTRPAAFNVGIGGMQSTGFTVWHPGPAYNLTRDQVAAIRQIYEMVRALEGQANRGNSNLLLALRSFSSIYDRFFQQAEDRVLDEITCLEALWKLDIELSFRLAFRTAGVLATSDDERVAIYETLAQYYKIRSKVVHGSSLNEVQARQLHDDEPLRALVRRVLRAFLHLAVNPGPWTFRRLYHEVDGTLMHETRRRELQAAMGIPV